MAEARLRLPEGYAPKTVFFGGGTPSMLSPTHMERLVRGMAEHVDFSHVEEWSLEANPATFNLAKASLWRSLGVNRVSMGVQSFSPRALRLLGREHSPEMAAESVAILRAAGIEQVNLDLMFSLPGQSLAEWEDSLTRAIELDVEHISTYNLTYEEDTDFFRRYGADATDEETDVAMFCRADEMLSAAGYRHYEISNYAREGCLSAHNMAYWKGADYYGLGPGAFGTVEGQRYENAGDTPVYSRALVQEGCLPPGEVERLDAEARRIELLGLRLRMDTGLPRDLLPDGREASIAALCDEGLAYWADDGAFCLTQRGRLVADEIAVELL